MEEELDSKEFKELYKAITDLKDTKECKKFLRDLCTISELKAMSERWQVAKKVNQGIPYREIAKQTGASTTTVTRVSYWIHHGLGGYKFMLHRLG